MKNNDRKKFLIYHAAGTFVIRVLSLLLSMLAAPGALAQAIQLPGIEVDFSNTGDAQEIATGLKIIFGLTILSLAPAILIAMTSFTRIVIVLSMLRHAFGMQQTPPNTVIISLSLFLTLFSMMPTLDSINQNAYQPMVQEDVKPVEALGTAVTEMRAFMIRQTREQDLMLMIDVAGKDKPNTIDEVATLSLIPAFMLSELKSAFQIGFVIFLPFLLIDLVVASILMSMGMLMVPPMMISLPIKVLMFVLIDGWNLVVYSLLSSFA